MGQISMLYFMQNYVFYTNNPINDPNECGLYHFEGCGVCSQSSMWAHVAVQCRKTFELPLTYGASHLCMRSLLSGQLRFCSTEIQIHKLYYTVVNIWSGSKKFIKVVLRQERVLFIIHVWLWKGLINVKCWLLYNI